MTSFSTKRLTMRPWRLDDAEALFRYASDRRVSEMAMWSRHESVEISRAVIEEIFIPNPDLFAIVLKENGEPIGCIGLVPTGMEHFSTENFEREVGYWIGYPHWDKGMTTEALKGFVDHCRAGSNIRSLLITADSRNAASHRVAEKCGFEYVCDYDMEGIPSKSFRLRI